MATDRVNLCKVPPELKTRLKGLQAADHTWPEFLEEVARIYEHGVTVETEHLGGPTNRTCLDPGETHESVSDTMAVTVAFATDAYECDDCDGTFGLSEVLVLDSGEHIVCADCIMPEDRIH